MKFEQAFYTRQDKTGLGICASSNDGQEFRNKCISIGAKIDSEGTEQIAEFVTYEENFHGFVAYTVGPPRDLRGGLVNKLCHMFVPQQASDLSKPSTYYLPYPFRTEVEDGETLPTVECQPTLEDSGACFRAVCQKYGLDRERLQQLLVKVFESVFCERQLYVLVDKFEETHLMDRREIARELTWLCAMLFPCQDEKIAIYRKRLSYGVYTKANLRLAKVMYVSSHEVEDLDNHLCYEIGELGSDTEEHFQFYDHLVSLLPLEEGTGFDAYYTLLYGMVISDYSAKRKKDNGILAALYTRLQLDQSQNEEEITVVPEPLLRSWIYSGTGIGELWYRELLCDYFRYPHCQAQISPGLLQTMWTQFVSIELKYFAEFSAEKVVQLEQMISLMLQMMLSKGLEELYGKCLSELKGCAPLAKTIYGKLSALYKDVELRTLLEHPGEGAMEDIWQEAVQQRVAAIVEQIRLAARMSQHNPVLSNEEFVLLLQCAFIAKETLWVLTEGNWIRQLMCESVTHYAKESFWENKAIDFLDWDLYEEIASYEGESLYKQAIVRRVPGQEDKQNYSQGWLNQYCYSLWREMTDEEYSKYNHQDNQLELDRIANKKKFAAFLDQMKLYIAQKNEPSQRDLMLYASFNVPGVRKNLGQEKCLWPEYRTLCQRKKTQEFVQFVTDQLPALPAYPVNDAIRKVLLDMGRFLFVATREDAYWQKEVHINEAYDLCKLSGFLEEQEGKQIEQLLEARMQRITEKMMQIEDCIQQEKEEEALLLQKLKKIQQNVACLQEDWFRLQEAKKLEERRKTSKAVVKKEPEAVRPVSVPQQEPMQEPMEHQKDVVQPEVIEVNRSSRARGAETQVLNQGYAKLYDRTAKNSNEKRAEETESKGKTSLKGKFLKLGRNKNER